MIPYIDFSRKKRELGAAPDSNNPLNPSGGPFAIFVDSHSFNNHEDLEFLLRQADGKQIFVISTKREGNAFLQHDSNKPNEVKTFTIKVLTNKADWPYEFSKCGLSEFHDVTRERYHNQCSGLAPEQSINDAWLISRTFERMERAHILVTNNEFLLRQRENHWFLKSQPLNIKEATALVGLVQRCRGRSFEIIKHLDPGFGKITQTYGKRSFFHDVRAEVLTPSVLGNFPNEGVEVIRQTLLARMSSVLQCRDHIHEQILREQTWDSTETSGFYFEYYLVSLRATFDILAKLADAVYKPLTTKRGRFDERQISWSYKNWPQALGKRKIIMDKSMRSGAIGGDILDLISQFRNHYVHVGGSRVLEHADTSYGRYAKPILFQIPPTKASIILKRVQGALKGKCTLYKFGAKGVFIEMGQFVELLTPRVFETLENLLSIISKDGGLCPYIPPQQPADRLGAVFANKRAEDLKGYLGMDD